MKVFRSILLILTIAVLTACGPQATEAPMFQGENPYAPQSGDSDRITDDISIESSGVSMAKSQPPQLLVNFEYFPPTVCHELRVEVSGPDGQNQIHLKAYAVAEKDQACILIAPAEPLQANLNLGSFPSGQYTVVLNGNQIGEFNS